MKNYGVLLPITGQIYVEVEAETEEDAIEKALEAELLRENIEEWDAHKKIVRSNIFYGLSYAAEATEI